MLIIDGFDLIILAVGFALLIICGIFLMINRIAYAAKKRRQKHKDKS